MYNHGSQSSSKELKSVQDEMSDAYYAADGIVQRVEYILRGLNGVISAESFVARAVGGGAMSSVEGEDATPAGEVMNKKDAFHAMLDLIDRMEVEGNAYAELRRRVRSQLVVAEDSDSSSSSSSSSDDDSDSDSDSSDDEDDDEDEDGTDEESFNQWTTSMEQRMKKAGFSTPNNNSSSGTNNSKDDSSAMAMDQEDFQFGAAPGTTTHMYDLLLDAMACLVCEQYNGSKTSSSSSSMDIVEIMGEDSPPPPALAKLILDKVLHRHWLDGGDIGLGAASSKDGAGINGIANGIGIGSGTGSGSLANVSPSPNTNFDVRTCPTTMTFNAVLRITAEFDPAAHASAMENAEILRGGGSGGAKSKNTNTKQEQERLRDITLDAAFSTYHRMKLCSELTLQSMKNSTKNATSRSAIKKQAKLLTIGSNVNYKSSQNNIMSGRNAATYAYLIQTITNCIPASLSRGNIAFGLYHKACVQEGVLDGRLVKAMRGVGGYEDGDFDIVGDSPSPPIANGPIFDSFMEKELGGGLAVALEKGRKLRQDRNYKLRRHVEWDDTY